MAAFSLMGFKPDRNTLFLADPPNPFGEFRSFHRPIFVYLCTFCKLVTELEREQYSFAILFMWLQKQGLLWERMFNACMSARTWHSYSSIMSTKQFR